MRGRGGCGGNGYFEVQLTAGKWNPGCCVFTAPVSCRTGAHFPGSSQDFLRHVILYNFHFLFPPCCVIIKNTLAADCLNPICQVYFYIYNQIDFSVQSDKAPTMKANIFIPK